ncbi:MAG: ankyrin repeat domain-containing protein, partial [Verrucomicrobiaceae bacterium]
MKELLARGTDPNRKTTLPTPDTRQADQTPREFALVTPFEIALGNESGAAVVEAMLAKGASANLLNQENHTLLSQAVRNKNVPRLKLLLKAGADPDMAERSGWTPLMLAAQTGEKDMVPLLLEAGADPNKGHDGLTPLSIATNHGGGWPIVELLFAKGAKPETATFQKALDLSNWDFALKLLEAGAPLPTGAADPPWNTPLVTAASSAKALPLIEKMIAMGVKPDDGWIKFGFGKGYYMGMKSEIDRSVRSFLFRRFILPTLEESTGVRIAIDDSGYRRVGMLDDLSGDQAPRPLAQSLLDPAEAFKPGWHIIPSDRLTVWRKSTDGWTAVAEQSFGGTDEFPMLQRGDLIEITDGPDPERIRSKESAQGPFTPELQWHLRQRVSFPVTLEIDGKVEELKMRGDRLIHDPTSKDLPWCSAGTLAGLRWKPGWTFGPEAGMSVVVIRKKWPEVRLPFPSDEASKFALKAGDRVKLETPSQAIDAMTAMRKRSTGFRAAGLPYGWMIECAGGNNLAGNSRSVPPPLIPSMAPTLCQLLAETQVVPSVWAEFSDLSPGSVPVRFPASAYPATVLPHPDWSRIRILRL